MSQTTPARLRDLTPQQWKSGLAAWLGWTFDGLDMHLYTLVATACNIASSGACPNAATTEPAYAERQLTRSLVSSAKLPP